MANGGSPTIHIDELNRLDALRALSSAWNDLEDRSDTRVPCLHPEYAALWLERLGRGTMPRVLTAWQGDQLVGYAPFMETKDRFGPVSVRALKFIGNNTGYPGDILYADVMACRNHPEAVPAILAHARSEWKVPKWDFGFLASSSPTLRIMADTLTLSEDELASLPSQPFVYIQLPDSWEGFLSAHPRAKENFRHNSRKLEKVGDLQISAEVRPGEVARQTAAMLEDHARWWGTSFKGDWFGNDAVQGFLVEAAELLASWGRYIIFTLKLDGQPISWTTGAVDGYRYTGYQRTYNRAYASCSPGSLLDLFVVKNLLSRGVSRIDVGPGLGPHKKALGARSSSYVQLLGYRGWHRHAARIARQWSLGFRPARAAPKGAAE